MSVAQLSVYHSLLLMFKILSTKSLRYLYSKLSGVQDLRHYKTRFVKNQKETQTIVLGADSQAVGDLATRSFKYRVTAQWNTLPVKIRQAETLRVFKKQLKDWVSENIPIK